MNAWSPTINCSNGLEAAEPHAIVITELSPEQCVELIRAEEKLPTKGTEQLRLVSLRGAPVDLPIARPMSQLRRLILDAAMESCRNYVFEALLSPQGHLRLFGKAYELPAGASKWRRVEIEDGELRRVAISSPRFLVGTVPKLEQEKD